MVPDRFEAADIDGGLCVKWTTTDYSQPTIVVNYWPTAAKTLDFLRWLTQEEGSWVRANWDSLLASVAVSRSRPGEYYFGRKLHGGAWQSGMHLSLVDGSATRSIKTETFPAPPPKVKKGVLVYWSGGCWVKHLKSGTQKIDPLNSWPI